MIISLLFNWRDYEQSGNYWHEIRDAVFGTQIIQESGRHMKLSIGDVLVGIERRQDPHALFMTAFGNSEWGMIHEQRLFEGFPTVFGMIFENMPCALASELHDALEDHDGYLGAISMHFELPAHLALYRLRLPTEFRLQGKMLRQFYHMGNREGYEEEDLNEMKQFGYTDVGFEDLGASRTILDDFDTARHFERVAAFRKMLVQSTPESEDDAYELAMLLEDLSPRLFNALGAAAERLAHAETEEEIAQVGLSGRRYIEQLADALFPPKKTTKGERRLGKAEYKNRLWAFVARETLGDEKQLKDIGANIDRLVEEFNKALHSDQTREGIAGTFSDAAKLTAALFSLNPEAARNGYLGHVKSIRNFIEDLKRNA
jgi:hypothetical protein